MYFEKLSAHFDVRLLSSSIILCIASKDTLARIIMHFKIYAVARTGFSYNYANVCLFFVCFLRSRESRRARGSARNQKHVTHSCCINFVESETQLFSFVFNHLSSWRFNRVGGDPALQVPHTSELPYIFGPLGTFLDMNVQLAHHFP